MKKILILLLTLSVLSVNAQNTISIGFTNGLSYSSLRDANNKKYFAHLPTYVVGGSVEYGFINHLAINGGIMYEKIGCTGNNMKVVDSDNKKLGFYSFDYTYDYLRFPILLKVSMLDNTFHIIGGGYFAHLINYGERFDGMKEIDRTNDMSKTDMGLTFGVGYTYTIDACLIVIEARENMGMSQLVNGRTYTSNRPAYEMNSVNTRSFNLLVGVRYNLK